MLEKICRTASNQCSHWLTSVFRWGGVFHLIFCSAPWLQAVPADRGRSVVARTTHWGPEEGGHAFWNAWSWQSQRVPCQWHSLESRDRRCGTCLPVDSGSLVWTSGLCTACQLLHAGFHSSQPLLSHVQMISLCMLARNIYTNVRL